MENATAGHNMVNIEDGGAAAGGNADDPKITTNPEINEPVNEPGGDPTVDGGTTTGTDGEDVGTTKEGTGQAEENPEGGAADVEKPLDPAALKEEILKELQEKMAPPPAQRELTEEEWTAREQESGTSRQTIKFFTNQSIKVYNAMREYIDEKFAGIEKDGAIRSIASEKGFSDAVRYSKEINQYLQKFNPKFHSNPQILRDAVIYARGLNASKNLQRANNDAERNRRIAGTARPSSPGATGGVRRPGTPGLTRDQRDVAAKFGMTDSEYSGLIKKRGTPIAA